MTKSKWGGVAASLVAVTLAGCGGGSEPSGTYKAADAERLANVAPRTPGWPPGRRSPSRSRPRVGSRRRRSPRETRSTPSIDEGRQTSSSPTTGGPATSGETRTSSRNLVVGVFDTAADAHVSFLANNELSRAYGAKYGFVVRAEKVDGLGDEAWRLWTHGERQRSDVPLAARQPRDRGACPLLRRLPARRGRQRGCRSSRVGRRDRRTSTRRTRLAHPACPGHRRAALCIHA